MNTIKRAIEWLKRVNINDNQQVWQAVLIIEYLLLTALKKDKKDDKNGKKTD